MAHGIYTSLMQATGEDVLTALRAEKAARKPVQLLITQCPTTRQPNVYRVQTHTHGDINPEVLDELHGQRVSWVGMPHDSNVTLDVHDASQGLVALKGKPRGYALRANTVISVWERDYLAPVIDWWTKEGNAELALQQLHVPSDSDQVDADLLRQLLALPSVQGLSESDKAVLALACKPRSILVGPPGTGKTTRLAAVVCAYMELYPKARVLLLSFTNRGIDELMLRIARSRRHAFKQTRVGAFYDKDAYQDFPWMRLKQDDPIQSNVDDPNKYFSLGADSGSAFEGVYGMTCFAALQRFPRLTTIDFDLVIFDEASQVPLTHGLPLLALGRSVIIAGDDVQLNPVCKTREPEYTMFNGMSPFVLKYGLGDKSWVMLLEQYRMPYVIGKYVSDEFYGKLLRLAECVRMDEQWQQMRRRRFAQFSEDEHLIFESIGAKHPANDQSRCQRIASAERIVELIVGDGYGQYSQADIAVLTPFHSQVYLVRDLLNMNGLEHVTVSTTHSKQGAQYPLVFFDPVDGYGAFMQSPVGDSIINVAVSRTQSKLITVASDQDCRNLKLSRLREYSQLPNQLLGP